MRRVFVRSYQASVFIAGDLEAAKVACRKFCDEVGECVTVTPTTYIYTGGQEDGVIVGFINYGRFPRPRRKILARAYALADWLILALGQTSASVVATDRTSFFSTKGKDE